MVSSESQSPSDAEGRHLLLFDGFCGLCSRLVQFVLGRDRLAVFHFASLQSVAGRAAVKRSGNSPDLPTTIYVFADYRKAKARLLTKARAVLFVMDALGWPWKAAGLLGILPTGLLDALYDLVARNRYRVFGRREQCLMPRAEFRGRFIDSSEAVAPEWRQP
jgi:predicted DCC family thiol-disulfide oxidoreductase YuxK